MAAIVSGIGGRVAGAATMCADFDESIPDGASPPRTQHDHRRLRVGGAARPRYRETARPNRHRRQVLRTACQPDRAICRSRSRPRPVPAAHRSHSTRPVAGLRSRPARRARRAFKFRPAPGAVHDPYRHHHRPQPLECRHHAHQSCENALSHAAGAQRHERPCAWLPRTHLSSRQTPTRFRGFLMRIAILSRSSNIYSTRRLKEAAAERGHEVRVVDTLRCYMNIASHRPEIHFRGGKLEDFDAVVPRIGASITFYGASVLRQFEMMGTFPLNESVAISRSRDKLRSLQLLSRKGIGLPVTGFAHRPDDVGYLIKMVGGAPLVIKLLEGTQGIGVVLAETNQAAESVIEAFMGLKANILVQEYIKEAGGADIRCFVIGDKVVAAMKRQGKEGEFRSNLHRGGSSSVTRLTPEERMTAIRAARIMGLNVAGIDLLRSNHGPVVMEVNSSPGLEGIEKATGKDVAALIHYFIEKQAKPGRTRTKGQG